MRQGGLFVLCAITLPVSDFILCPPHLPKVVVFYVCEYTVHHVLVLVEAWIDMPNIDGAKDVRKESVRIRTHTGAHPPPYWPYIHSYPPDHANLLVWPTRMLGVGYGQAALLVLVASDIISSA
jgi:hypothetical protein